MGFASFQSLKAGVRVGWDPFDSLRPEALNYASRAMGTGIWALSCGIVS